MTAHAFEPSQVSTADWKSRIAAKSKTDLDLAEEILARHAIEAQSVIPRRRTITLTGIKLAGTKSGVVEDGSEVQEAKFSFDWGPLGPGLWVVASDRNARGKSSVLNVFKAALKGSFPGSIKPGVWRWLAEIEVGFKLDDVQHRVVATKPAGSDAVGPSGGFKARLERDDRGTWTTLASVDDGDAFESVMSDFFMQELGFEKFHAYQGSSDSKKTHGWPSMGSALFMSGAGPALFGSETADGLPLKLLQLFIGLPWISTYTAISTSLKQVNAESARLAEVSDQARGGIEASIGQLRKQRDDLIREKATLPDRAAIHLQLRDDDRNLATARRQRSELQGALLSLQNECAAASSAYDDARNLRRQLDDELSAGHVFRRLRPSTCPSCDADVHPAHEHGNCPLCGEKEKPESEEASARIESLREDERQAKEAKDRFAKEIANASAGMDDLDGQIAELEARIGRADSALTEAHKSAEIEGRITALTGGIDALEEALPPAPRKDASADAHILKAALDVTRECFDGMQQAILEHFSTRLREIATRIGVTNLTSVSVKSNQINIIQEDVQLTFSRLTQGEKLRFRIAAALAAVETAKWSGTGRHPGLIVLDSPAAEEMSGDDFGAVLASLQAVMEDQPDVQVVVSALMRPQISGAVSCDRMRYARGDDPLF